MQIHSRLIIALTTCLLSISCGGETPSTDEDDSGTTTTDAMTTPEGIAAFLASEGHRGEGWQSETDEPRERSSVVSPHDQVRVFFNDTLISSQRAGNGEFQGTPHDLGSMAVKELYDGDTLVGHAVIYQAEGNAQPESTVYYCVGPERRCLTEGLAFSLDEPAFGRGMEIGCGGCHGGMVFTTMP